MDDLTPDLFTARYREPFGPLPTSPVIDALLAHRSVRAYLPAALPDGALEAIVAAAQSAPTSSNLQAWSVMVTTDPARKAHLAALAGNQAHIAECPTFLLFCADLARAARIGEAQQATLEGLPYLETFLVAAIDAALAGQNAAIAAESLGLGTVYIGSMRNHPQAVAEAFGLPHGVFGVFGLCLGYEDPARPAAVKPRLPQSIVLHNERYQPAAEEAGLPAYDARLQSFQAEQAMPLQGWRALVLSRLGILKRLSGRDKLRDILVTMGFPLR